MNGLLFNKSIHGEDYSVLYGFSLFETFLVRNNYSVFLLEKHIDRLLKSMKYFDFYASFDAAGLFRLIKAYIEENNMKDRVLRITVTYGNKKKYIDSSVLFSTRHNPYSGAIYDNGFNLSVSKIKKDINSPLVRHKTANYLENLLEGIEAQDKGYDDAIFLNSKGEVTETTRSNIFFIKDGILQTPDLSCGLLPGIIRNWVFEQSSSIGIKCIPGVFDLQSLLNADEVFVTNSVMGIMPVKSIQNSVIGTGFRGPLTTLLIDQLRLATES